MTLALPTLTLLARELEAIGDRLELVALWLTAATLPHDLRSVPRDLAAAAESVDLALMDVRDTIAETSTGLDASMSRHPAGRALDDDADATDPHVSEFAGLAVSALAADPERTRAALADIANAGVTLAPGDHDEATTADATEPPAAAVDLGEPAGDPDPDAESTFTQVEVELKARDAIAERTEHSVDWELLSDAVDVYLIRLDADRAGEPINRAAIDRETAEAVVEFVVSAVEAGAMTEDAGEGPEGLTLPDGGPQA